MMPTLAQGWIAVKSAGRFAEGAPGLIGAVEEIAPQALVFSRSRAEEQKARRTAHASATIRSALREACRQKGLARRASGEVAERLNAAVSKTVVLFTVPGVRIPPSPLWKAKNG